MCRMCQIASVDASAITTFLVHECEGSNRMGSRPRRYLFTGHTTGAIQVRIVLMGALARSITYLHRCGTCLLHWRSTTPALRSGSPIFTRCTLPPPAMLLCRPVGPISVRYFTALDSDVLLGANGNSSSVQQTPVSSSTSSSGAPIVGAGGSQLVLVNMLQQQVLYR